MYTERPSTARFQTFTARSPSRDPDRTDLLTATVHLTGPEAIVVVCGELDASTTPTLEEALYACHLEGHRTIRVVLSGLDLLTAAGIEALAREAHVDRERGGQLSVDHRTTGNVRRVLDMCDVPWQIVDS
jgi:anti-anti-sigma factor